MERRVLHEESSGNIKIPEVFVSQVASGQKVHGVRHGAQDVP